LTTVENHEQNVEHSSMKLTYGKEQIEWRTTENRHLTKTRGQTILTTTSIKEKTTEGVY